jgi:hypothetical protein
MTKKESGMRRNEFKTTSTAAEGARMAGKSGRSRRGLKAFLPILIVLVAALAFASGAVALTDGAGAPPSVYSDQADYAPGSTVTLTGTGWQPDEVIHLFVNDNVGNTWSWSADLTADGSGNFTASLTLSSGFVASYGVTATGSLGGSASTSFTDASLGSLVGPSSPTTSTNASFTWSVSGSGGSLQPVCSLDSSSGPWVNCSSPKSYTGLSTGSHTFYVKLSDKIDSTAASWPWTINPSDATPPYVVSISRAAPTPTNATSVSWTVTFSESVSGVDSTDFALASAVSAASITDVTGTGSSRTVTAGTGTGDGTLGLNLVDDNSIVDGASNVLGTSSGAGDGGSTGQVYSIDKTKPLISAFANNADTTSYIAGTWTNQSVTVSFTCSDGTGSGISSNTLTGGGVSTETSAGSVTNGGACTDNAGNSANAVTFSPIKIDTTAPTINCGTADGSWHAVNVSIACTASDGGGSGLASAEDGSFSLSTNVLDGSETNNAATGSRDVYDVAGNKATAGPITGNEVDKKAPSITNDGVQSGTAGSNGWYVSAVGNGFSASDGGSGLSASCNTAFPKNVSTGTDEGSAVTVGSGACTDAVGNSNAGISSAAFKIDLHSPTVSCGSADMAWHADNVSIACTASDGGSGLVPDSGDASFNLSTSVGPDSETSNASTGTRDVTDVAGRTTQAGPIGGNKIDRKAPQLSGCDTADGNWHAADVTLHCTYTDGGSGPASQTVSLTTAVNAGVETADAAASAGGVQACDDLNNCASSPADIGGNKIDRKAPSITNDGVQSGTAGSNGWYVSAVGNGFSASDGGSGLSASCNTAFPKNVSTGTDEGSAVTVGSGACTDAVGNSNAGISSAAFKIDLHSPTVSCGSADMAWHADNVSIACTASDGGSGLVPDSGDASFNLSTSVGPDSETSNASTGTRDVTDVAGRTTQAGPIGGNKIDRKAPQLSGCDTADGNWHAADVTLHCTYTDGGSGPASQTVSLTTAVNAGVETADAAASAGGVQACDDLNNCASSPADIGGNKIDRKAPVISCGSADSVWHGADQSVTCSASDDGSGLAVSGDSSFTLSTNVAANTDTTSAMTGTHLVADGVGNSDTAGPVGPFKIDKKAPTYTCDTAPTAWSGSDITINCTAADSGSGLNPVTDASFSLSTNVTPGTETSDASTGTKTLTDAVGHATTAGPITGLNVDKKNPTITFLSKTMPNTSGWNNASVTVNWTCSDGGSGIVSNSDSKTLATEGANKSATGTCTDNVGHTSSDTQTGINIDETAPTVAYTSAPAPNGAGWYKTNVVATFTATDTLSGFAGPSTTKTDTSTTSGEGSAVTVGSPAFTDLAGNTAVAGTKTSDPFKIDKTPPTVSVTSVSNLAPYTLGAVPVAGCSTTDPGGSGVATSATASVTGGTGNGVGTFTATCSGAVDTAGNNQAAPVSVTYTVNYGGLGGILQPINPDNTSVFSRGKAVPVKFQLGGDQPNGFNSSGWKLQQQPVNCAIVTDVGTVVEAVVDNPSNGFRYDSTADQYIYNANFKDQAVGTCWKVVVTLDSGQMLYSAVFKLQK